MTQTIALVDDDRNILTSISIALEREGFKVQTYIDGESALIGLTRNPPDLAILDIKMPRMDGEELLKKLKKKINKENLIISEAFANEGPVLRRFRPRAQGQGYGIRKPTCHISITVEENK